MSHWTLEPAKKNAHPLPNEWAYCNNTAYLTLVHLSRLPPSATGLSLRILRGLLFRRILPNEVLRMIRPRESLITKRLQPFARLA